VRKRNNIRSIKGHPIFSRFVQSWSEQ